jgi:hypothetical protein
MVVYICCNVNPSMHSLRNRFVLLPLLSCVSIASTVAPSRSQPIQGVTVGGLEKGIYLGVESRVKTRGLLEVGGFYLDAQLGSVDVGLSESVPVDLNGGGLRLAYSHFLLNTPAKSGPFVQAGVSIANLSASSTSNLDRLKFKTRSRTVVTCSGCGDLKLTTENPSLSVVPVVALGWQLALGERVLVRASIGAQYYDVPTVSWSSSGVLPAFARREVVRTVRELNSEIKSTSDVWPSAALTMTYTF